MKIIQTDDYEDFKEGKTVRFINAMEGKNYPIFATMYHPEYQLLEFIGKYKWPIIKN